MTARFWMLLARALVAARNAGWRAIYRGLRARYAIPPSFRFNGPGIEMYGLGRIELGEGSYVGEYSSLQAAEGRRVRIGRDCRLGSNLHIYTQTSASDSNFLLREERLVLGDVSIGDGVWIGVNVYVGPGVTIGDNAVIGANSVVTRDIPANEIWAGAPVRRLRAKVAGACRAQAAPPPIPPAHVA